MRLFTALLGVMLFGTPSPAHDSWGNGEPVPPWVKAACCGPEDVHHIPPGAVHRGPDGYHVDGLSTVVPYSRALPSPDGTFWGFWREGGEPDVVIFCFFAPVEGS